MGPIQSLEDLLGMIRRRRWLIGLVLALGIVLSVVLGRLQPVTFEAAAVIQVETQVVADGVEGASRSAQALQLIEQRLTTRENLMEVIDRHGLYAGAEALPTDQKVQLLRDAIRFQSVASVQQAAFGTPSSVAALIISARFEDPEQAARVANDLAQSVLDQSAEARTARSRETMRFFLEEESRVGQDIVALEAEIAAYRNANSAALPEAGDAQRDEITELDTEIRVLDQSLVQLAGQQSALQTGGALRALQQRQMEALDAQARVLEAQKAALLARRAEISTSLALLPEVERELGAFDRRLQQLQDQYEVVTRRLAEAETTQRLEERNQAERFTLLERAMTPALSSGGSGTKLMAAGLLGSLMLAFGLALVLEMMNPVLRTSTQMERQLDLLPVVAIPELNLPHPRTRPAATGMMRGMLIGGGVLALLAVAVAKFA